MKTNAEVVFIPGKGYHIAVKIGSRYKYLKLQDYPDMFDASIITMRGEEVGTGTQRGVAVFVSETSPTSVEENDIWIQI
jgi:hypothetical protein